MNNQANNMVPHTTKGNDPAEGSPLNGKITKSSTKSALKSSYPSTYYINRVITIVGLAVFLLCNIGIIPGTKLGFFCNDPLFSHKYRGDTITPAIFLLGISFLFPALYFCIEIIRRHSFKDAFRIASRFEYYMYLKQFIVGVVIVGGVTEIAKTIVGEHRPHFFDTCMPDTNMNCTSGTYIFDFTCTNPNATALERTDASRSFPSGHSSLSWFTAIYCAYIVHSRLPIHRTGTALKVLMFGISITFGLTCSLTRITDRRHHWWDVLAGTVIGVVGAAYVIYMTHLQVMLLYKKMVSEQKEEEIQEIICDI